MLQSMFQQYHQQIDKNASKILLYVGSCQAIVVIKWKGAFWTSFELIGAAVQRNNVQIMRSSGAAPHLTPITVHNHGYGSMLWPSSCQQSWKQSKYVLEDKSIPGLGSYPLWLCDAVLSDRSRQPDDMVGSHSLAQQCCVLRALL